ncbi:MAG: nodulation protein NfeD [Bacteroidaceae bacterium]|nr:nodulation protein NfeD [Bacteroidaceae bacterium]
MKRLYTTLATLALCIISILANDTTHLYRIDIHQEIGSTSWRYLQNGMHKAIQKDADAVILHLNTYGGLVLHADSMRTLILNAPIPVYAYIENNAASAGALIALACDSIYMQNGARMGAATVVNETGEAMPDKYQSYMRATMRATAQAHGCDTTITQQGDTIVTWRRNPIIAEAMVDERVVIPQLSDSGQILTFTPDEAIANGYCEGIVESVEQMITQNLAIEQYTIEQYTPSLYDKIAGFLTNPALQALMVTLIIGGIFFELKTPGIGFPSAVAVIAAILYFLPLFISGTAESWELLAFVAGIIFLVIELFVIPGFGVAGISGVILMLGALILATLNNIVFDFTFVTGIDISRSILTVLAGLVIAIVFLIFLSHRIGAKGMLYRFALHAEQKNSEGYIGVDTTACSLVGCVGTAITRMAPSGKVKVDSEIYDAVSLYGQYIEAGTSVEIIRHENNQIYVTPHNH